MGIELIISSKSTGKKYLANPIGDITVTSRIKGSATELSFSVRKGKVLNFAEGDEVLLRVNHKNTFRGFVFEKHRRADKIINVKCYDFLRYLKYEDCYTLNVMTASEMLNLFGKINNWRMGEVEDTKFRIPAQVVENSSYLDMIQTALNTTYDADFEEFVLFVKGADITLKNIKNMKTNLLITENTCCDFDYTSTIDENTYNKIKVVQKDKDDKVTEAAVIFDEENIKRWGTLQYIEVLGEKDTVKDYHVKQLLKKHNKVTRRLSITKAFGREDIRAGYVRLG